MRISFVAAIARNRVIGQGNHLPWRLPADLRYFKRITMGKPLIMGRLTYESIGRPLPGRHSIVLTRDRSFEAPGCEIVHSVNAALIAAEATGSEEVMVIGGGKIFELLLPLADRLYLTFIEADVKGDVLFPKIRPERWCEISRKSEEADSDNPYHYSFVVLDRLVEGE